jgi:zinc finger protein 830
MADVRALLKAKRQEVRITHPYAAYGANGALRCTACGAAIKFASAWEGHLGSKAHRVAVAANLRAKEAEEEKARRATATTTGAVSVSKRKAGEGDDGDGDGEGEEEQMPMPTGKKRQRTVEREIAPAIDGSSPDAHPRSEAGTGTGASQQAFPADFFSDPARAPLRTSTGGQDDDDDDDVEMDHHDQDAKAKAAEAAAAPPPPPPPKSQFDMEWDAFERDMQRSLTNQPQPQQQRSSSRPAGGNESADPQETYAHATIAAEPELVSRFEGLPVDDDATAQEGTTEQGRTGAVEEGGRKVSAEELERRRKDRDERELIMDRLMEEERAQEDAYGRVALLKNRMQMLKQKRELAKAKGKKGAEDMET